jgi:exosortase K
MFIYRAVKFASSYYGALLNRLPAAIILVTAAILLKLHYSFATADQLRWIIGPTAWLVKWFTVADPVYESGIGYADFSQGIIIAPSCAGVNFMIMAFGACAVCGLYYLERPKAQAQWIILSVILSYGFALLVNTARIAISMELYSANMEFGWLTMSRAHRIMGTAVYFSALWVFIRAVWSTSRLWFGAGTDPDHQSSYPTAWMILAWYLAGAIGVPFLNRAWSSREWAFIEHSLTVAMVVLALTIMLALAQKGMRAALTKA